MLKLFEMFSGYGGASFALKKSKIPFECIGISEIDKTAIDCYIQNHGNIVNFGDARCINPTKLPDFDILTGGFPCQPFSVAGKNLGIYDERGQLFFDIARIAREKQPKYMLLENVKGLLSELHRPIFEMILKTLDEIGYEFHVKILNSMNYGIPQNRERLFFVCIRKDLHQDYDFPDPIKSTLTLYDILDQDVSERYILSNIQKHNLLKNLDHNLFNCNPSGRGHGGNINIKSYANTITTHKGDSQKFLKMKDICKYSRSELIDIVKTHIIYDTNDVQLRRLTPNECFKLMGFMDVKIKLDNISDTKKHILAGNGWDINIVSKIFDSMPLKN